MGPFDFRPFSPLDDAGELLPLLTTRLSAPKGSGDDRVQGYNYRLCVTTNASNRLPFPAPESYSAATWEAARRLAALTEPDFRRWVGPGPLPVGAGVAAAMAAERACAVQDVPLPLLHAALVGHGAVLCKEGAPACASAGA